MKGGGYYYRFFLLPQFFVQAGKQFVAIFMKSFGRNAQVESGYRTARDLLMFVLRLKSNDCRAPALWCV